MTGFLSVDLSGLSSMLDELGDQAEAAARPAAQAAAQVLYDEARRIVASFGGPTGNLFSSIYQAYSEQRSGPGHAVYSVSWNSRKAPHGWLVENGYKQRYVTYIGKDGRFHTAVRPSMRGLPKPRRGASQAEKDAYYVTRDVPLQVPARSFTRKAYHEKADAASDAAEVVIFRVLNGT